MWTPTESVGLSDTFNRQSAFISCLVVMHGWSRGTWLKSRKTIERIEFFWEVLTVQGWMADSEGDSASQKDKSIKLRRLLEVEISLHYWGSWLTFEDAITRYKDLCSIRSQKQTLTLPLCFCTLNSNLVFCRLCPDWLSCHLVQDPFFKTEIIVPRSWQHAYWH